MDRNEIIGKLRDIMKNSSEVQADWDAVTTDSLIADLGFDSLSRLDLTYDIQQEFGIMFDAEELASVARVGELVDFIETRVNG